MGGSYRRASYVGTEGTSEPERLSSARFTYLAPGSMKFEFPNSKFIYF